MAPTLPLSAHRSAVEPGADMSPPRVARLVTEFLDRLGLEDVAARDQPPYLEGRPSSSTDSSPAWPAD